MNARIGVWILVALTLLAGCVPSLNPVYTERQLVFDPHVLGVWIQSQSKNTWEFTQRDETSYRLVFADKDGRKGRFIARLADIDGTVFLDLFPETRGKQVNDFHKFHLVPIHTIYRVTRTGQRLELAAIDYQWLDTYLTDHPGAIQFATVDDGKLITAPTADVQAFVVQHKEMFTGELQLERRIDSD